MRNRLSSQPIVNCLQCGQPQSSKIIVELSGMGRTICPHQLGGHQCEIFKRWKTKSSGYGTKRKQMLRATPIELVPATELIAALRDCSQRAIVFGLIGGEPKLR